MSEPKELPPIVAAGETSVLPLELDRSYPLIVAGDGVWFERADGERYLDAMSGGSMAATLGLRRPDLAAAASEQAARVSFVHNERLTNPAQEQLAAELAALAPGDLSRVQFVTGGAEANESALRLARSFHVERGEGDRWQVISPAQAYHGPTMATLALTGRPGLHGAFGPYLSNHLHIPPASWRFDPTGEEALAALDAALAEAGPGTVSAFYCEAISAAALPAYSPPDRFWEGLAERRDEHGFLICIDEIVTGMGRTGAWFASERLPFVPDIIATAKGLGAGHAAIGALICRDHVAAAIASGSGRLPLGHTWNGAPLSCAVGLAVIEALRREGLIERVAERGVELRGQLEEALAGIPMVREVRGHGFLLGVEYVDPRDRDALLDPGLGVAGRIDDAALRRGLVTLSTQPTGDGYAGDQSLFAPAFVATDEELSEMVDRFSAAVAEVAEEIDGKLGKSVGAAA